MDHQKLSEDVLIHYKKTKHSYARIKQGVLHLTISSMLTSQQQQHHIQQLLKKSRALIERRDTRVDVLKIPLETGNIQLYTGETLTDSKVKDVTDIRKLLKKHCYADVLGEVKAWHLVMNPTRQVSKLRFTTAKTRWGSCTSTGTISLSIRTLLLPYHLFSYVCAHEIAHLTHMNHGPQFWNMVAKVVPDYKSRIKELATYY